MFKPLNQKGQVAIFIALIFQVLFLFFAMIINVGLLVHHKINLQNSVDLAAYYGASKQAEMLNAIGHVNYQIRQSWKLLTWRYRQLGSAGNFTPAHPYNKISKSICPPGWCGSVADIENIHPDPQYKIYYTHPSFCITYIPFRPMPPDENTCKVAHANSKIPLFKPPPVVAPFLGTTLIVKDLTEILLSSAQNQCSFFGPWNYVTLARFVVAFSMDQAEKKLMMRHLALGLSDSASDFYDIEGESVKQGIENTLKKNLTSANAEDIDFEVFNSLGTAECGESPGTYEPPRWLSEVKIFPAFSYVDTSCNQVSGSVDGGIGNIHIRHEPLENIPYHTDQNPQLKPLIEQYKNYVSGNTPPPYNMSIGYEKNPWCMAYVGVKAQATPKIPFAPLGRVTLRAKSYAKPFGGRIGPWYGKTWSHGQYESDKTAKVDPLLPPRARDPSELGDWNDPTRIANFSKYPGDQFGHQSRLTLGHYGKAIYEIDPKFRTEAYQFTQSGTGGQAPSLMNPDIGDAPNFKHWDDLAKNFKETKHGDILSWDSKNRGNNLMRRLEITAIAPDVFDITYYSIEPDFFNVYFKKIRDGFLPKKGGYSFLPRADLGSRVGDQELESFSVKDQLEVVQSYGTMSPTPLDVLNKLTYIAYESPGVISKQKAPLLTSWVGKSLSNYGYDSEVFAKCLQKPMQDGPTSGDCVGPGRSGYSVKIVSESYLNSEEHAVGGNGTKDKILNPPPENF